MSTSAWFGGPEHLRAPGDDEPLDWCDVHNMPVWSRADHQDCDYPDDTADCG